MVKGGPCPGPGGPGDGLDERHVTLDRLGRRAIQAIQDYEGSI
jgi:hypothetical protein